MCRVGGIELTIQELTNRWNRTATMLLHFSAGRGLSTQLHAPNGLPLTFVCCKIGTGGWIVMVCCDITHMKFLFFLLVVAWGLLTGCRNDNKDSANARDWEAQMKQSQAQLDTAERQAKRTDDQQAKAEEQEKRMDKVIEKWEEQGRRLDAILDKLEKANGTNK